MIELPVLGKIPLSANPAENLVGIISPIATPLMREMEDREMALKMWHPGSRNTCVISKDSLILALAARSPSPCSADSKINHFFPLAQWMRIGGLGGGLGLCPLGLCPLVLSSFSLHNLLVLLY